MKPWERFGAHSQQAVPTPQPQKSNLKPWEIYAAQSQQGQSRTATNPKTGERLTLKDGKWTPLATEKPRTATNPQTGERIQLVNGKWEPFQSTRQAGTNNNLTPEYYDRLGIPQGTSRDEVRSILQQRQNEAQSISPP